MKLFAPSLLSCVMIFSLNTKAGSQPNWSQVPLPNIYTWIAPYFLTANTGFVFEAAPFRTQANLRKTTDGGNTWQAVRFFDDANIFINQLYFTDLSRGYAATTAGIYETLDSGITWKSISPSLSFNSVYAFGNKVFAFASSLLPPYSQSWGPLLQTGNDGAAWDTILKPTFQTISFPYDLVVRPMRPYVFGNNEGTVYAENVVNKDYMQLLHSTNNGTDWSLDPMDISNKTFTMGFFAFPHCNDVIRTYLSITIGQDNQNDLDHLAHSTNFGAQWNNLSNPFEIGSWIVGNNCVQYVSDARGNQFAGNREGLWRSVDRGNNWIYISGPTLEEIDDRDFHNISVVGDGAVLYVSDITGKLWKTTTGGDGKLSSAQFASKISIQHVLFPSNGDTLKVIECDTGLVKMSFQNISCNFSHLQGITIDGLDSSEFSTLLIHHLFCDGLPDTLLINVIATTTGKRNITVHPRFINDEYQTIDTSFTFTLVTTSASGTSIYLKSAAISGAASDTTEIPLYINNISPAQVTLGMDSIILTYLLNTDLVTPFIFAPAFIGMKAGPVKTTATTATFTLYFPPGFTFTGETVLGKLRCKVFVTDTLETDIAFTGNGKTSPCQSIASNSGIHFSLAAHCDDSTLSNFIKYGAAYSLTSIIPNPARNSVQIQLKNNDAELHYELFDALGNQRKNGMIEGNSFQINLSDLSAGSYYLRISGEKRTPITKKLVIAK